MTKRTSRSIWKDLSSFRAITTTNWFISSDRFELVPDTEFRGCNTEYVGHFLRSLTVAAVIPGNSLRRPTFRFSSVLTWNLAVVLALHTVSQLTVRKHTSETLLVCRCFWTWGSYSGVLLVMSTSAVARGARLGEANALKLPASTFVTRFPR